MKILFVINDLEIGGAETFLMRFMKELHLHGHSTYIYTLEPAHNNIFEEVFLHETNSILVKGPKPHNSFQTYIFYKINAVLQKFGYHDFYKKFMQKQMDKHFRRLLKDNYDIDIINSHMHSSDIFSSEYLKPLLNIPHVITMQGCYESVMALNDKETTAKAKTAILNCNGFTYVAEKNLDFLKFTNTPVPEINRKIYNGLPPPDKNSFKNRIDYGITEDNFVIGQVSRSIEEKGMEISIKAVEYLIEKKGYSHIKLIIIGPENYYYNGLKTKYAYSDNIIFPGQTYNALEWIGIFDIGILPTFFPGESCPSSIIEYLACSKPVVSTISGEIPIMIDADGEQAGILVSSNRDNGKPNVTEIADSIAIYYNDRDLYKRHTIFAGKAFNKFQIEKITDSYLDVYKEVLSKKL